MSGNKGSNLHEVHCLSDPPLLLQNEPMPPKASEDLLHVGHRYVKPVEMLLSGRPGGLRSGLPHDQLISQVLCLPTAKEDGSRCWQ